MNRFPQPCQRRSVATNYTFSTRARSLTGGRGPGRSLSAFTLIELLTVIAIIAVLASILIPVTRAARRAASSAQSTAQMRKIGMAMQAFAMDKRGALPTSPSYGTLFVGQGPWFNRDDRRFQMVMGTYLESSAGTTWAASGSAMDYDATFAWSGLLTNCQPGSPSVLLNASVKFVGVVKRGSPWSGTRLNSSSPYVGRRLSDIEKPSAEQVFTEVDQQNTDAGWKDLLPEKPIHGNYRNTLFFDWHVGQVAVNN